MIYLEICEHEEMEEGTGSVALTSPGRAAAHGVREKLVAAPLSDTADPCSFPAEQLWSAVEKLQRRPLSHMLFL